MGSSRNTVSVTGRTKLARAADASERGQPRPGEAAGGASPSLKVREREIRPVETAAYSNARPAVIQWYLCSAHWRPAVLPVRRRIVGPSLGFPTSALPSPPRRSADMGTSFLDGPREKRGQPLSSF